MSAIRRRLAALLALLLILGILLGLPLVLLAVGANPLPGGIPTFEAFKDALGSPDDGTLAVGLIKIVAWVSWAFLTLSILLEVLARLRGVRAPRLPGLRLPQHGAHALVGTAALLFVALPAPGVASAAQAAAPPAAAVSTAQSVTAPAPTVQTPVTDTPSARSNQTTRKDRARRQTTVQHTVRRGETLWAIAATHLGDGHRYKEILDLNRDVLGDHPGFIQAGWVLDLPAPPRTNPAAAGTVVVEKGDTLSKIAADQLGDASRYPEIFEASRSITQPGGAKLTDPDVIDVGWTVKIPAASPPRKTPRAAPPAPPALAPAPRQSSAPNPPTQPAAPAPAQAPAAPAPTQATPQQAAPSPAEPVAPSTTADLQEESPWTARTLSGVGALLAAGVLTLLATRRRTQQRRRRPGQRMPLPTGPAALVEQELRATADTLAIETVDVALRSLARTCAENSVPLPAVRAARLAATQFDLYLAEPANLPAPWTDTTDATVWTLEVDHATDLPTTAVSDIPAPYPALVTIGHDEDDGHVLLNLEFLGTLGVSGQDDTTTREVLAALALELANSTWADDLQVTLVGAFPDLEDTLQTGRIRYLPSAGSVLQDLLDRADRDRQAMSTDGAPDLHHARVTGAAPAAWPPEIVLFATPITDRQRNQLQQLVTDLPRVALATITTGLNVGEWGLNLATGAGPEYAVLSPIGLQLRPQRLPSQLYGHLLEIASLTDLQELDPAEAAPLPSLADVETITPVDEWRPGPVSAMPEITLDHLEAAATREPPSDPSDSPGDPTDDPAVPHTHHPTENPTAGDDDEPATQTPEIQPSEDGPVDETEAAPPTPETRSTTPSAAENLTASVDPAPQEAPAPPLPPAAPRILVLGTVNLLNAAGNVEPTKRARLQEYAAYLALNPGTTHTAIDNAIWPDRRTEDNLNTRNTATSKLRRWVGTDPMSGEEYLPRLQSGEGYSLHPRVTTDATDWDRLLAHDPLNTPTEQLEEALALVRGTPFEGTHRKRYAWAEPLKQRLISEIVDASYELARRRLMEGRWRGAERAAVVGLRIEPAQENLWRLRILAAHESRNPAAEAEAIERLLTITEQLECDLEPETEQLLAALKTPGTDFDKLMANAL